MAKINITVDTETDEMMVEVNGVALDNVNDVCIYSYDGEPSVSITQVERGDDVRRVIMTQASIETKKTIYESEKAKTARLAEQSVTDYVVAARKEKIEKRKNS